MAYTIEELTRHPGGCPDGTWCTAEVLEHLYLTYTGTVKGLGAVSAGRKTPGQSDHPEAASTIALVIGLNYFPQGSKSPERARPKGMSADKVMAEIGSQIATMGELLAECEARYGAANQSDGPSHPRTAHRAAVAKISLGARAAPCETNPEVNSRDRVYAHGA